jgi:HK97 family phage portal protein
MSLHVVGVDPQKAQSVEARKAQIEEIARVYRMQLHMLGDLDHATFSNIEQQSIEFVTYTLMPYLKIWEQAIQRTLFAENEKATYFAEFNVDGLLRGDIASRYAAYAIGRSWGWLSANDICAMENRNPVEGGDIYLQPLNYVPVGTPPAPVQMPATPNKKLLAIRMALQQLEEAA